MGEIVKPEVVGAVVVRQNGKYLLVQERKPIAYGLWNLPAGRMEVGMTPEETAVKEAKEETGFDVELIKKIKVFQTVDHPIPKHVFEAKIIGGELGFPKDEILDAKWFAFREIEGMKDILRQPWVFEAVNMIEMEIADQEK